MIDQLVDLGFVDQKLGFNDRLRGRGFLTRMWPTRRLIDLFAEARFSSFDIFWRGDRLPVELKNEQKELIEFEPPEEFTAWITTLNQYNALLLKTFVSIPALANARIRKGDKEKDALHVSQANKFTKRTFNNGSFDMGGRFYGGWWQNCPKNIRRQILLNDWPTNELDYSSLHPTLLYSMEGIDYHRDIGGDPYAIEPVSFINDPLILRQMAKYILLIAFNASDQAKIPAAFRKEQPAGSASKRLTNQQVFEVVNAVKNKHTPIEKYFGSGIGLRLQNTDSRISEEILKAFIAKDEPVLLVHDSYIVRSGFEEILEDVMQLSFNKVTGTTHATKIKYVDMTSDEVEQELMARYDFRYGQQGNAEEELEDMRLYSQLKPKRSEWYQHEWHEFQVWLNTRNEE